MPSYSGKSNSKLNTVTESVQRVFRRVIQRYDHSITEGHRTREKQEKYFLEGKSKVHYPNSKHNKFPSDAVDAAPYIPGRGIPWPQPLSFIDKLSEEEKKELSQYVKDYSQFAHFAGYVQGTADEMGEPITSGIDWDGDRNFADQWFDDLPHFQKANA